ncbi:MAG: hypothetical protein MHM6MM_009369 [Cercozoa sp. M6MM]
MDRDRSSVDRDRSSMNRDRSSVDRQLRLQVQSLASQARNGAVVMAAEIALHVAPAALQQSQPCANPVRADCTSLRRIETSPHTPGDALQMQELRTALQEALHLSQQLELQQDSTRPAGDAIS